PPHPAKRRQRHALAAGPALLPSILRTNHGNGSCLFADPRSLLGVERGAKLFRVQPGNAPPPLRGPQKFPRRDFQNHLVDSREPPSPSLIVDPLQTMHPKDHPRMWPEPSAKTAETCRDPLGSAS